MAVLLLNKGLSVSLLYAVSQQILSDLQQYSEKPWESDALAVQKVQWLSMHNHVCTPSVFHSSTQNDEVRSAIKGN
jgi:hypothetical protein